MSGEDMANEVHLDCAELGCNEEVQRNCMEMGTCAVHGVEVERRKNTEKLAAEIPTLLTAVNKIIGSYKMAGVVLLASFTFAAGSFLYTKHEADAAMVERMAIRDRSDASDQRFAIVLNQLTYQVTSLATSVNKSEERHDDLVEQLQELNSLLRKKDLKM